MKHIKYPKIGQFRNCLSELKHNLTYISKDENGKAKYRDNYNFPKVVFIGTVKLHGTNASVCFNSKDGMWIQSRNNIITPEKDNAGFAQFVIEREEYFQHLIEWVIMYYDVDTDKKTISIFGEWAGKGIQKGVAISEIEKSFFIFGVKLTDEFESDSWLDFEMFGSHDERVYNIKSFETYRVEVDLNNPEYSQNDLEKLTMKVEERCPVAIAFGKSGIGEGIVWHTNFMNKFYRFKTKGEKHSVSKVKRVASVDVEKLDSIKEFVEYSVTQNRFDQAIENVFNGEEVLDMSKIGEVIRWMNRDINQEEEDVMVKNNLTNKDVAKYIAQRTKKMYKKLL